LLKSPQAKAETCKLKFQLTWSHRIMNLVRSLLLNAAVLVFVAVCTQTRMGWGAEPEREINLAGQWSGTWRDCQSGHHGPLNAKLCRIDDCRYRAVFSGRFWGVVPFRYGMVLEVVGREGDRVLLSGSKHVGISGEFECCASGTECELTASFKSKRYNGVFELKR
jgi:hypothetical protein